MANDSSINRPPFESSIATAPPQGTGDSAGNADLVLADHSETTKTIVRAAPDTAAAGQLGVSFGNSRRTGEVIVVGIRPDEWLLLGVGAAGDSVVDQLDRSGHVSVIDHTHSRALIRLTGARASAALEKVCSIDWTDAMTPDGSVVSASVAKVSCDILRHDLGTPSYLIACDRSFGQYVFDALLDAGDEFGIGIGSRDNAAV